MSSSTNSKPTRTVEGIVNVSPILNGELINDIDLKVIKKWINSIAEFYEGRFLLEFVAADLDSSCKQTDTVKAHTTSVKFDYTSKMFKCTCMFEVPKNFGKIGAVLVDNAHKERYIKNIVLDNGNITFTCESWIQSKDKRIFFTNQSYLPAQTPNGLRTLRQKDLVSLRGKGQGQRKPSDRIYDYDMYNDLGDPDTGSDLFRPVLGGEEHPYPRRCRTGRPMIMTTKGEFESRDKAPLYDKFYVPRDEAFSDRKVVAFAAMKILDTIKQNLLPKIMVGNEESIKLEDSFFNIGSLREKIIEKLFDICAGLDNFVDVLKVVVPRLLGDLDSDVKSLKQIDHARKNDTKSFCWYEDDEFCRQTLAGINPYSIQLVTEWPLRSKLDPQVYGPSESAITKEIVQQEIMKQDIKDRMPFEEALEQKKLFMLDYHDLLLPYVNRVRKLKETTLYGSRTLMFLTSELGILKPIAIELTRPQINKKPQWKQVYIPCTKPKGVATNDIPIEAWLWKLAKAHVLAHDSGYHQLISHWLRTHCVMEPYIIATHRCLSKMHPIHSLLFPHFRYTMQINSLARVLLIDASGIIESTFSLGKYSMEFSSYVYDRQWRFDHEGLPADLISRGMGVADPSAPNGIKLAIEDYPFANDGLILWDAIKKWATTYVNHYYPQENLVDSDEELQAWWNEIRTVGHGDKKDEPWWPELKTQQDLIETVSTIMWVASGHHSAVNFGQYTAGYYPTRPTIARTKMPDEDPTDEEQRAFQNNPEDALTRCLPLPDESSKVMSVLDILSSHSPDEEYIGVNIEAAWEAEPTINAAFQEFSESLTDLGEKIDSRNNNSTLKNRMGKGLVRYELFKTKSEAGVTGKGVPYSISI